MDRYKKRILRELREASSVDGFVNIPLLQKKGTMPTNEHEKDELIRYFQDEGYLEYDLRRAPGQMARITAKAIDVFDPWWIHHEEAIVGAVIGGVFALLGTILGYFLGSQ